jgi:hypothetical protein
MHNFVKFLLEGWLGEIFFGELQMTEFTWCKLTALIIPNLS